MLPVPRTVRRCLLHCCLLRRLAVALLLTASASVADDGVLYRELDLASRLDRGGVAVDDASWVAFEWFQRLPRRAGPGWSPELLDLYAGVGSGRAGAGRARLREAWLQWVDAGADAFVRLGRLPLPYGLTPTLELRGEPLLPLLHADLGSLREWGVATRVHARGFVYEAAASWDPDGAPRRPARRPLFTARVGVPAFRDLRYGLSTLYGTTDGRRGPQAAWRLGADVVYLPDEPYTSLQAEGQVGADGSRSVWGWLLRGTHILRADPRWQVLAQASRWHGETTRRETSLGFGRALPHLLTLRLLWRHGGGGASLFLQLHRHAA